MRGSLPAGQAGQRGSYATRSPHPNPCLPVRQALFSKERGAQLIHIVTLNAEMVVEAQKNKEFRAAIEKAELVIPDGASILWAKKYMESISPPHMRGSLPAGQAVQRGSDATHSPHPNPLLSKERGARLIFSLVKHLFSKQQPLTGVDGVFDICEILEQKQGTAYLIGGTDEEQNGTKKVLQKKFKNLKVEVIPSPSDREKERMRVKSGSEATVSAAALSPHTNPCLPVRQALPVRGEGISVAFVALGAPKQTFWIEEHRNELEQAGVKIAIGVGGAFSIIAGRLPRAPKILRDFHLEWLWRLCLEPKRLRRIWNAVVVFPLLVKGYPH